MLTRGKSIYTLLLTMLALTFMMSGCRGVKKFVRDDERILYQNYYEITTTDGAEPGKEIYDALDGMKKYTQQKANTHILGVGPRFSMRIYCLSNPDDSNFINSYLRRKGQKPVIYDEYAARKTCDQLTSLLYSKGCFNSVVTFDTVHRKKHDVKVKYNIAASQRYIIDDVRFKSETPEVTKLLRQWQSESFLQAGDYYDQEKMERERNIVIEKLRNEGYYYASTELVSYIVDTAFDDHKLSIVLNIANPRVVNANRQIEVRPLQKYRFDEIFIYPNSSTSSSDAQVTFDTLISSLQFRNNTTNYYYLYNDEMALRPEVINRALFLFHRQTFRPRFIERTYNSLLNLRNFKYINIEFAESPNSCDTNRLLNAKIRLLNARRQRFSASVEVNNSSSFDSENQDGSFGLLSGNFGLETKLTYQNKNLFGGAELFKTEWSMLIELPKLIFRNKSQGFANNISNMENGINMSLDLPTFLFPFTKDVLWQRMRPHTVINLGANYQLHSYFERLLFNTGMGYNWSRNLNVHQLMPLELTYVRFFNIDSSFRSRIANINDARLKYQYSDHFIMDARYDYVYNSQRYGQRIDFNYLHLSAESAGNLLAAIENIAGTPGDENGIKRIFGVPFSQYLRFNAEYKHYFYLGQRSTFVTRVMTGVGLPYGNSTAMPYEKSFFGGGPTTIRAWHLRQLGPGTFQPDEGTVFERIGDIQFVANLEYRFPLFAIVEGALFTDFGNVWLTHKSEEFEGGEFNIKSLHKSIAAGIGLGIRANISIVTLRCDLAIPFYDPGAAANRHWRPAYWKISQVTANFGIDYPF